MYRGDETICIYCTLQVAITNVLLWATAWTPYAVVAMIGNYGDQNLVTPLVSQLPVFLGEAQSPAAFHLLGYN